MGRYARRNTREHQDSNGCIKIARDSSESISEAAMRLFRLGAPRLPVIGVLAIVFVLSLIASAQSQSAQGKKTKSGSCPHDDSGLKLPAGFCATVFAEGIGHPRHLVVSPGEVVYVNTWSGDYYDFDKTHEG